MSQLSINRATDWSQGFLRREWRLALPISLAFVGLPAAVLELVAPNGPPPAPGDPPVFGAWMLVVLPAALVTLLGAAAISALALVPGISVAEALRAGARRLGVLLLASIVGGLALGVAATLAAVLLGMLGAVSGAGRGGLLVLTVAAVGAIALLGGVRLALLTPVVMARPLGAIAALRESWRLTRGHFWLLAAILLMLMLAVLLVSAATQSVAGVAGVLLGRLAGAPAVELVVRALAGALVNALVSMTFCVFMVALYRELAATATPSDGH